MSRTIVFAVAALLAALPVAARVHAGAVCHIGNIYARLRRSLNWDAAAKRFTGDAEANRWLFREYGKPRTVPA